MYAATRYGKDGSKDASSLGNIEFYGITVVFLALSYVVAMSVSNLGVVLELVGATGNCHSSS